MVFIVLYLRGCAPSMALGWCLAEKTGRGRAKHAEADQQRADQQEFQGGKDTAEHFDSPGLQLDCRLTAKSSYPSPGVKGHFRLFVGIVDHGVQRVAVVAVSVIGRGTVVTGVTISVNCRGDSVTPVTPVRHWRYVV